MNIKFFLVWIAFSFNYLEASEQLSLNQAEKIHQYFLQTSVKKGYSVQYEGFLTRDTLKGGMWNHETGVWHFNRNKKAFKLVSEFDEKNATIIVILEDAKLMFSLRSANDITKKMNIQLAEKILGQTIISFEKEIAEVLKTSKEHKKSKKRKTSSHPRSHTGKGKRVSTGKC